MSTDSPVQENDILVFTLGANADAFVLIFGENKVERVFDWYGEVNMNVGYNFDQ